MREIASEVWTWSWFSAAHGYDFNGYFVRHAGGHLCIDPVEASEEELDWLGRAGVSRILITNRNHTRAANRLRERTGALTAIHPLDAPHARAQGAAIDAELEVGGRAGPLEILGVPGKSPGEVAFYWRDRGILFVGDAVIGHPPGRLSLLPERVIDDLPRLKRSVAGLLDYDFSTLLLGDGTSLLEGAREKLRALVESFGRSGN